MLRKCLSLFCLFLLVASVATAADVAVKTPEWAMNATIIEACSCPMFCQCYFDTKPAGHMGHMDMKPSAGSDDKMDMGGSEHYCKFNNAIHVNKGQYGAVKLDGAKFWVAGDLGADFGKGDAEWAVVHFDKSVTKEQRDGILAIVGHVYPPKFKSFNVGEDADMVWDKSDDGAHAALNGGKLAEVTLKQPGGRMSNSDPMVIKNLKYWGAPRNDGFVLMGPNDVEAYRTGDKAFEFKHTNGFMITFDITSKDTAGPAPKSSSGGN